MLSLVINFWFYRITPFICFPVFWEVSWVLHSILLIFSLTFSKALYDLIWFLVFHRVLVFDYHVYNSRHFIWFFPKSICSFYSILFFHLCLYSFYTYCLSFYFDWFYSLIQIALWVYVMRVLTHYYYVAGSPLQQTVFPWVIWNCIRSSFSGVGYFYHRPIHLGCGKHSREWLAVCFWWYPRSFTNYVNYTSFGVFLLPVLYFRLHTRAGFRIVVLL